MTDFVLIEGDRAEFQPVFGPATVVVSPGLLSAAGPGTWKGKKICVEGDEKNVSVPGCVYTTPQFSIPGMGTLEIVALGSDQKATQTRTGGKAVLLKGSVFTARFQVQAPAQQPPPGPTAPIPDPIPAYTGQGIFVTSNTEFRGT